jgi:choline transport protein
MTIGLFITTLVAMVVRSSPKASSSFVWTSFINYTGWPDGVCFIIGLSTSCFMYLGVDAAMHLAEECHQPSRTVPKAIMSAVLIGFTTAFPFTIALLYGISDIDSILTATG